MEEALKLLEPEFGAEVVYEGPEPPPPEWYEEHPGVHIELDDPPGQTEPPPEKEGGSQRSDKAGASPERVAPDIDKRRVEVPKWRWDLIRSDLSPTVRHVGLTLSVRMDPDGGGAFPRVATIARDTGRSEKTVRRALRTLEATGYLHCRHRPGRSTIYLATVPDGGDVVDLPVDSGPDDRTGTDQRAPSSLTTPSPDDRTGPVPLTYPPGPDDRRTSTLTSTPTKQQPSSLTEAEQIKDRMLEFASLEVQRRLADGWDIYSLPNYARKIAPDFHDQAVKELRSEQRAAAIATCTICDDNGFIDTDDQTRERCDHVIRERKQHHG